MSCMLGQLNEPIQKEKVIYYLSITNYEINYITSMGHMKVVVVHALLHHMVDFPTWTLSSTSLKS